jgi:hypothetical protein
MAFQSLPQLVDGQFLSASYLNTLGDNVAHLYGAAHARNMPFQGFSDALRGDMDASDCLWYFRMRAGLNYLHYEISVGADMDYLRIKVDDFSANTTLFANETPGATHSFVGTAGTSALVADRWYRMWVELDFITGESDILVKMLVLADNPTFGARTPSAYTTPVNWSAGAPVPAANINRYKTGLDAAHELIGGVRVLQPVRQNNTEDRGYFLWHQYRWLVYIGDGTINGPNGVAEDIALTGDGGNMVVYDLANVEWLSAGQLYEIEGCTVAMEDDLPTTNS